MAAAKETGHGEPPYAPEVVLTPETRARMQTLEARLKAMGSLMVAYSGGVDSAFLAAVAHRILGTRMLAVLADSPSLSRSDKKQAVDFAEAQGIPLRIVKTEELENPEYIRNDANRCFYCKSELFTTMKTLGAEVELSAVAYGLNADDRGDYRPGQRAAAEQSVLAPLADAGLTKAEIRQLSREAGFLLWDRPAAPCLASRVEYGRAVTREVLSQVEEAEEKLHQMGFRELRVRHHGSVARVEISRAELSRALNMETMDAISEALKAVGFQFVALDCSGFRSGSLNDLLPAEVLAGRGAVTSA